ncbi:fibropellin-1-like [Anneissia japonica]|uniref:fibropellin-1-like n=1 Tax=Anneissia japonica TaxID=1529436 RepID=UPI001425632D|nr:fibropellin-1-like [Anneissia japonica]
MTSCQNIEPGTPCVVDEYNSIPYELLFKKNIYLLLYSCFSFLCINSSVVITNGELYYLTTILFNCDIATGNACSNNPCLNGGACSLSGSSFACQCPTGFSGTICQTTTTQPCQPNPCQNNGVCTVNGNTYFCNCPSGFSGINCQTTAQPCQPNPCQNNGVCTVNGNTYFCNCPSGFSGINCQTAQPCQPNPCQNNGVCTVNGNTYFCNCPSGFSGINCQTAQPCQPNPCQNNGVCTVNGNTYFCNCPSGFSGINCQTAAQPCQPNPCQNNGVCTVNGNTYFCTCQSGFSGINCQTTDSNCDPICQNGGVCNMVSNTYVCTCPPSYSGADCTVVEVLDTPCASNPCPAGQECFYTATEYRCMSGRRRRNVNGTCACVNNGRCMNDGDDNWKCLCPLGFSGVLCEDNICAPNPCANAGTCMPISSGGIDGYMCHCKAGYGGANCMIASSTSTDNESALYNDRMTDEEYFMHQYVGIAMGTLLIVILALVVLIFRIVPRRIHNTDLELRKDEVALIH